MNLIPLPTSPTAADAAVREWMTREAERDGLAVVVDPLLTHECTFSKASRTVWVRPGLERDPFVWAVARAQCELYWPGTYFGELYTPATSAKRSLRLIQGGAR